MRISYQTIYAVSPRYLAGSNSIRSRDRQIRGISAFLSRTDKLRKLVAGYSQHDLDISRASKVPFIPESNDLSIIGDVKTSEAVGNFARSTRG